MCKVLHVKHGCKHSRDYPEAEQCRWVGWLHPGANSKTRCHEKPNEVTYCCEHTCCGKEIEQRYAKYLNHLKRTETNARLRADKNLQYMEEAWVLAEVNPPFGLCGGPWQEVDRAKVRARCQGEAGNFLE